MQEGTEQSGVRVSTTSPSQWGRVLSIEVPRARLEAERTKVLRDLRRKVVRPGFRKGHVPAALVEREFADRIQSDALDKLIPDVAGKAIEAQDLKVISAPKVRNLVLDDPEVVRFDLAVDVQPTIELRPLAGLSATRWIPNVTDEDLVGALASLRQNQAQFVGAEHEARDGDYVLVSYVPLDDVGRERASQRVETYPFQVGAGNVVAEFESAVRGLVPGGTARAEVRYAEDHEDPELAGKTVTFLLTLKEVKEKRIPPLDDDLARDLGLESLDALREQVRGDLGRRMSEDSDRDLRESIVDHLLASNPFEAPESMIESWVAALLEDFDERFRRANLEPDPARREEFAKATQPGGVRAVRRMLILEEVTKQQGLSVSEADVDQWIEDKVEAAGPEGGKMRAFWADARRRRRLRSDLAEEKVFDFLKSKTEITEVPRPAPGAAGA